MARKVEVILGYVEKPGVVGAASTSVIDQYNSDKHGFDLVNQGTQTSAAVRHVGKFPTPGWILARLSG